LKKYERKMRGKMRGQPLKWEAERKNGAKTAIL
jgi:hypothetical protein